jgi:acetolactate synthase I/II/III large subunit
VIDDPKATDPAVVANGELAEAGSAEPDEAESPDVSEAPQATREAAPEEHEAEPTGPEAASDSPPDAGPTPEAASDADPELASLPATPVEPTGPRTVGRFIADALRAAGVRIAFTVPGESFLGVLDAFDEAGIRVVATRHEGGAAFMAEAYGQLTGRPAACLGTRAVGGANLAIGIHTARQDSTPLFALIGQVQRSFLGREAFQEIDQVATLGGLAKWAAQPMSADEIPSVMAEAVRQALGGRPGPVLLALPEDLLDELAPEVEGTVPPRPGTVRATESEIRAVLHLLAGAERPVILAGAGVLRARTSTELVRFAELLHVPIIASWRHGDVISNDHPLFLGTAGVGAPDVVRERLEAADAILVLGSRLNEPTSYGYTIPAADQRWMHVDVEPHRAPGLPAADRQIVSDARTFLKAANEILSDRGVLDAALLGVRDANNLADRAAFEVASAVDAVPWDGPGVHPGRIVTTLREVLPDDAIVTTDAGNFGGWAGRGFRFRRPGTFLGPTSGAMGYGLPAAIAAALVHRDRAVVALTGDGGLAMTLSELETAVREHARVVVLVFDNQRYGTIRMWQEIRGTGQGVATELGPVDFAAAARAFGANGAHVNLDSEFEPALRRALAADGPTVIQLALDKAWVSVDQPAG